MVFLWLRVVGVRRAYVGVGVPLDVCRTRTRTSTFPLPRPRPLHWLWLVRGVSLMAVARLMCADPHGAAQLHTHTHTYIHTLLHNHTRQCV